MSKHPRPRIACWFCGKNVGVHADDTLWAHISGRYGPVCVGSDKPFDIWSVKKYGDKAITAVAS